MAFPNIRYQDLSHINFMWEKTKDEELYCMYVLASALVYDF